MKLISACFLAPDLDPTRSVLFNINCLLVIMMPWSELVALQQKKKTLQQQSRDLQKTIKAADKKRHKIMERARHLSPADLLQLLTEKNEKVEAKEKAKEAAVITKMTGETPEESKKPTATDESRKQMN